MRDSMFPLFPSHAPHLQAAAEPSGDTVQLQVGVKGTKGLQVQGMWGGGWHPGAEPLYQGIPVLRAEQVWEPSPECPTPSSAGVPFF